ncbi:MAG: UDP-2,3-diacylglucosamine diphosphatase [Bacteroidota bacterium]
MSLTYFISDAHFGLDSRQKERDKEQRLIGFLDHVRKHGKLLYVLGDLFDFWFEYKTVIPKGYHRLLAKLSEVVDQGIPIKYIAGNHDFWMRGYLGEEVGIQVFHDPIAETIEGKKFYLHHGDGLSKRDFGYRMLKKVLRNPVNIWLYSWIHPDIGVRLAQFSSRKSRHHTSGKDYGKQDGLLTFAESRMNEGYDYIVMGHRHEPVLMPIGSGWYVNLGDWIDHCTYGMFDGKRFELKCWNREGK